MQGKNKLEYDLIHIKSMKFKHVVRVGPFLANFDCTDQKIH